MCVCIICMYPRMCIHATHALVYWCCLCWSLGIPGLGQHPPGSKFFWGPPRKYYQTPWRSADFSAWKPSVSGLPCQFSRMHLEERRMGLADISFEYPIWAVKSMCRLRHRSLSLETCTFAARHTVLWRARIPVSCRAFAAGMREQWSLLVMIFPYLGS